MPFEAFIAEPKSIDFEYSPESMALLGVTSLALTNFIAAQARLRRQLYPEPKYHNASPETFWHYTGADAAHAILREGALRMTNVRFLNDSSEYEFATAIVRKRVDMAGTSFHREEADVLIPQLRRRLELIEDSTVYVACFSGVRDLLSQWNGYAANGYAIGFGSAPLLNLVGAEPKLMIQPCLYEPAQQNTIVDAVLADIRAARKILQAATSDATVADRALDAFAEIALGQVIPYMKHSKYKEEGEWRIASLPAHVEQPIPFKLVTRGRGFAPFTEVQFRTDPAPPHHQWLNTRTAHPILEVMIAPPAGDSSSALVPAGLNYAVQRYGYTGIKISGSEIPHRSF
jgi:hypothetical protein